MLAEAIASALIVLGVFALMGLIEGCIRAFNESHEEKDHETYR